MEKGNRDIFVKKYDGNLNLVDSKQLTSLPTNQDSPSLAAVGSDFLLAYQSMETGADSGGDIFLARYDQNWKALETVQLTDQKSYQDRPSLAVAGGDIYVAYVSSETGNRDIFQKRLDENLEVQETKRMTSDKSDQDYPSLKWTNGQFMLLYASKKTGNYEIMLDRYLRDWKLVDSTICRGRCLRSDLVLAGILAGGRDVLFGLCLPGVRPEEHLRQALEADHSCRAEALRHRHVLQCHQSQQPLHADGSSSTTTTVSWRTRWN